MPDAAEGTRVYVGLGSNLGDRAAHLARALARLAETPGVEVVRRSTWRETEPVGGPPQGRYLNGAAELRCSLTAPALLSLCKAIEGECGRDPQAPRNSPRPLDIDILLFGDGTIDRRGLVVPHPRLHEREFALEPLRELGVDVGSIPRPERPRRLAQPAELAALCQAWTAGGCRIGLVPTMGALHAGHGSLLALARGECDRVAVTVFVNPLQFDSAGDLERYPRTLADDLALCREHGADAVLVPDAGAMYGDGFASHVAVGAEAEGMEGAHRRGHFAGVATVVAKLLVLARPDLAYFGDKDAQQVEVIERLVRDLGFATRVRRCPTVRDADGLALSSRNVRLLPADRAAAPVLYRALRAVADAWRGGERDPATLAARGREVVAREPRAALDYLEVRGQRAFVAARFGDVRLIDNLALGEPPR